jgi:hypothetical protein
MITKRDISKTQKVNQMTLTKVLSVLKWNRAARISPTSARQSMAEDKNEDDSVSKDF